MLRNLRTGCEREVDIVVEGMLDGEPMIISIEVTDRSRPADVGWVESMLEKHRYLPTNRLLLVSRSGFSPQAIATVETEAGRVQCLTPEFAEVDGETVIRRLFVDQVTTTPTGCDVHLFRRSDLSQFVVRCEADVDLYLLDSSLIGQVGHLVLDLMHLSDVQKSCLEMAREHPERNELKGFKTLFPIQSLMYCVKHLVTGELDLIQSIAIWGDCEYMRAEVALTQNRLGDRMFRFGEAPFGGRPAVWVETTDEATKTTKISWQWTDVKTLPHRRTVEPYEFHLAAVRDMSIPTIEPYPADSEFN